MVVLYVLTYAGLYIVDLFVPAALDEHNRTEGCTH
jgi:hypothetical protein